MPLINHSNIVNFSSEFFLETQGIKPGAAGWEASMLPLCYAAPCLTLSLIMNIYSSSKATFSRLKLFYSPSFTPIFLPFNQLFRKKPTLSLKAIFVFALGVTMSYSFLTDTFYILYSNFIFLNFPLFSLLSPYFLFLSEYNGTKSITTKKTRRSWFQ